LIWARGDDTEELYGDPLPIWRAWADDVAGLPLDSGHHMAEEVPDELSAAIREFVGTTRSS
jgi:haloacetate dehalogenase